jgi:hypothetical protein
MIKEIQEEPSQDQSLSKDMQKKDEPKQKDLNSDNQNINITSELNKLSINSDESKSSNKDTDSKKENEDINQNESKIQKKKLTLSKSISISNDINTNNNLIKTPLRKDSTPYNFKQKAKINFQEKSNLGNGSGNEYKYHRNSISLKSPIYSYFDQSQKFLSEQYSEENLFNLTGKRNKKISSNKNIPK